SRRRHTRCLSDWSSDVCSSDLEPDSKRGFQFRPAFSDGTVTALLIDPDGTGWFGSRTDLWRWESGRATPLEGRMALPSAMWRVKIGRASWREGGGVVVGGGAGT